MWMRMVISFAEPVGIPVACIRKAKRGASSSHAIPAEDEEMTKQKQRGRKGHRRRK
jgi:hypothetical protein